MFAAVGFLQGLGKFNWSDVLIGHNWPLFGQLWPKSEIDAISLGLGL